VHALRQRVVGDNQARPDGGDQLVLGQHLSRPRRQKGQQIERLRPERDRQPVAQQLAAQEVEGEGPEQPPRACRRCAHRAAGGVQRSLSHSSAPSQDAADIRLDSGVADRRAIRSASSIFKELPMTRTLSVTAAIVFAALLSVQFARVVLQPTTRFPPSVVTTAPAGAPAADGTANAIEDLAAWPIAAGR